MMPTCIKGHTTTENYQVFKPVFIAKLLTGFAHYLFHVLAVPLLRMKTPGELIRISNLKL
jgi:hypothetical protein